MGWSGAGRLLEPIVEQAKRFIPDETKRAEFYVPIVRAFKDEDWDTEDEMLGLDPALDVLIKR